MSPSVLLWCVSVCAVAINGIVIQNATHSPDDKSETDGVTSAKVTQAPSGQQNGNADEQTGNKVQSDDIIYAVNASSKTTPSAVNVTKQKSDPNMKTGSPIEGLVQEPANTNQTNSVTDTTEGVEALTNKTDTAIKNNYTASQGITYSSNITTKQTLVTKSNISITTTLNPTKDAPVGQSTKSVTQVTELPRNNNTGEIPQWVSENIDDTWMIVFLHYRHFEGQYSYDGGLHMFNFIVRYVHQNDIHTLVATLYDEDGAILEMNGTSTVAHRVIFKLSKIYSPGFRFPLNSQLQLDGQLKVGDNSVTYKGNITVPINSSFTWFHMNKGLGKIETGDVVGTRKAIIVIICTSVAFLAIITTVAVICWASKKGYLRGRHKSYQLFKDTPVAFESEAETIHI